MKGVVCSVYTSNTSYCRGVQRGAIGIRGILRGRGRGAAGSRGAGGTRGYTTATFAVRDGYKKLPVEVRNAF